MTFRSLPALHYFGYFELRDLSRYLHGGTSSPKTYKEEAVILPRRYFDEWQAEHYGNHLRMRTYPARIVFPAGCILG
jgi:hypothetical protein